MDRRIHHGLLTGLVLGMVACAETPKPPTTPLFDGLGHHHRAVTTKSKQAQQYVDQGIVFMYAFNHDEAIRSFRQAAEFDPNCAMAWWGISLANGPHINNPIMPPERSQAAWEALQKARETASKATPTERALIEALGSRYADPPPADRSALEQGYADAMRRVWQEHPNDADVGALFAEAMMDLRPWNLWLPDGTPQPGTAEILTTLRAVLTLDADHPLANHLLIHAVEASPHPSEGLDAADRLRTLVPGAGHLVHMPAHIYARVGRWKEASEANEKAIVADREYRKRSPVQEFYNVYMAHNHHFLAWASMMQGQSAVSIHAAREMIAGVPPDFLQASAFFADGYMTIALEALMRFGKWDEILQEPAPPAFLPITTAHRFFARGVAYAAKGEVGKAKAERELFRAAVANVTPDHVVGNNPAQQVLRIAAHLLDGEIAYQEGHLDESVAALTAGVAVEDSLKYNESPDWLQPVRHTLGGVLLEAGKIPEAEAVYRADLERWPENGWALFGLSQCLSLRQADAEAREVEARFAKTWAQADIKLDKTCLCLHKPM
jgi:tetratricopeptide (TPR) repeat protein